MRLKADSKHKIPPETIARAKLMSGKLNYGNAAILAQTLNTVPTMPKRDTRK